RRRTRSRPRGGELAEVPGHAGENPTGYPVEFRGDRSTPDSKSNGISRWVSRRAEADRPAKPNGISPSSRRPQTLQKRREPGRERSGLGVNSRELSGALGEEHAGVAEDPPEVEDVVRRGRDRVLVFLEHGSRVARVLAGQEDLDREAALEAGLGELVVRQ